MFVVLEGIDGCGKSTVAQALKEKVQDAIVVHAPTDSAKQRAIQGSSKASTLFIMLQDMITIMQDIVIPAMLEGKSIIMDRFWPSTAVYQTQQINKFLCMPHTDIVELCARAIGIALMESFAGDSEKIHDTYFKNPMHIFVLDVSVETAMKRAEERGNLDAFENVSKETIEERRNIYLKMQKNKDKYHVIPVDGKSVDDIVEEILSIAG